MTVEKVLDDVPAGTKRFFKSPDGLIVVRCSSGSALFKMDVDYPDLDTGTVYATLSAGEGIKVDIPAGDFAVIEANSSNTKVTAGGL